MKLQEVEDLYRPFKQKRKTKATVAKSKGLEPLADYILSLPKENLLHDVADQYISAEKEVASREEAIEGAKHIIAEQISDDPHFRKWIRQETYKKGFSLPRQASQPQMTRKTSMKCTTSTKSRSKRSFLTECLR